MKSPHEFYLETNGRVIDVDKSHSGQCWDLFAYFTLLWINMTFSCYVAGDPDSGYVIELWNYFEKLGLDKYFEKVYHWQDFQDGDWVIWKGPCQITQYSHIAMFRKDEPNTGGGIFLTQNPNGNPNYTHQMWISYNNYVGALRPKCYITQDKTLPTPIERDKNKNQFKINCDNTMNIRLDHTTKSESIGFGKTGFYNILQMVSQDGYNWYEVEKGKWCALVPPYSEFVGMEENKQETPKIEPKEEDSPIIPEQLKKSQNEPKNTKIGYNIIKIIIDIIKKIFTYKN